ncbi:MAG: cytochrome b/b6 domain-containing protein [Rhodocyclaceae bacterium]|nr:cytochrome b/b6 domain-containing protein [Rhodocyclaceae bacterium]
MDKVLIWDWPVRIGHWLLVGAFALAWITGDSEEWRLVHAFAGGTVVGVILFRLLWGLVGTRHARFASFVRGPRAALDYVLGLLRGDASQYAGHNAAGGWAIVALLTLGLLTGASGWLTYQDMGGEWLEEVHEALATGMLAVAAVHVAGVVVSSLAHRENLPRSMLTGLKQGRPDEAIANARPLVLVVLLGWVVACAWWLAR